MLVAREMLFYGSGAFEVRNIRLFIVSETCF